MTIHANRALRRDLEAIFQAGALSNLADGELLERFASRGGPAGPEAEAAFSVLIERHGPMVLRVCRGVLGDAHDAEDAFQATFLVLLRQAGAIRKRDSVGPWLHGVAHRVASCVRSAAARRRAHERRWSERRRDEKPHAEPSTCDLDLAATIHAELGRLPERYRAPIVLCDLEDHSLDEAARRLGWPLGTIKSRLNRGRQQLRDRLVRRGVAPSLAAPLLSGLKSSIPADAASSVSPALAEATIGMVAGVGNRSAEVLALVEGFGRMVIVSRMRLAAVVAIATGLSAIGIGALAGGPRRGAATEATAPVVNTAPGQDKAAAAPAKKKARPRRGDDSRRERIAVAGRATDPAGKPVAGATIYVIDTNRRWVGSGSRVLATATTDPDGRYVARDVELPVWEPDGIPLRTQWSAGGQFEEEGRFQVAATDPGFGFTWHPVAAFRPADRPRPERGKTPPADDPDTFHRGEPIAINLSFGPPASVHGKVTDTNGRLLPNAKVQVGLVDDGRREGGKTWRCRRVDPTGSIPDDRLEFDGIHALPETMLSTRTGPDGTYRIDGLPREALFLARIDPGPEFDASMQTIATTAGPLKEARVVGHDVVLDGRFLPPGESQVRVVLKDTKQPVRGATVRARPMDDRATIRAGGVGVTDAEGWTTLHLRHGGYDLAIEPPFGMPYLLGSAQIPVSGGGVMDFYSPIELEPAAIVTMEARDMKTDAPIEGVTFRYETDSDSRPRELQSQPAIVDRPATDEQGRLRAVLEPGRKRFSVGTVPPGWKFEGRASQPMFLTAGREILLRWSFTKVEEPKPAGGSGEPLFPEDLVATWDRRDRRALPGRFRVRHYHYSIEATPSPDQLEALLDANDLGKLADPAGAIEARLPTAREGVPSVIEILDDGRRRRNTVHYQSPGYGTEIIVANGRETVDFGSFNAQSNIFGPTSRMGHQTFGWRDICARPGALDRLRNRNRAAGRIRREESGGRLTVEETIVGHVVRCVVDRRTGFVLAESRRSGTGMATGQIIRQYGPKVERDGVIVPTVHVLARLLGPGRMMIDLDIIDEVDLTYRPTPADFAIAAPAGTVIMDYREDGSRPAQRMNRYPVADVLAFADANPARHRSIEPVLKVGQPAPAIEPASWLDRDGPAGPPDVAGKVVLVDFWGISCGPCVAELPKVQAAADHFAGKTKDLVIVGLHESGASAEQVAEFARKRGLTYRLAIDRPAGEDGWFGATFKDHGVRAIPAAAVIDRKGNIAFVGRFPEALKEAAKLMKP